VSENQLIERNEIFELAYRFVTETNENIFLTGKAGTGKTTFLKYLKDHCSKNVVVAAPTGVAAINAGGVTLHSLFQLPFHPFLPTEINKKELLAKIRFNKQRVQLLRKVELLVIDEISMVRCDVMDALDTILKSIRRNYTIPFGGVQLLCIGDLHQLPPVAQNAEWTILKEYYDSPFFFDSLAVKDQMPLLIELDKIYRQKEESFVELLNKVRNNEMEQDDFTDLHERYIPSFIPEPNEKYITLTSHNNQADQINLVQLEKLFSTAYRYKAIIEEEFPVHIYPAEPELVLKEGAQVMFLKNDTIQKKYFNGKIGTIKLLEDEKITVDCNGTEIGVYKETWENTRYTLNKEDGKLEQETIGTFSQYPLRLAWAITIHKSQGLTFDKVMIDAGAAFNAGQVYVALSRCTSLDGIVLLSKIQPAAIKSNENVLKGQQNLRHKGSLAERFAGARKIFTLQLLENIFFFNEVEDSLKQLAFHIKQHADKLNKDASTWIGNLLQQFLSDKNTGLKFISKVVGYLHNEGIIENNTMLQQRIMDASNHFLPSFVSLQKSLQTQPLITEHKETATIINELLLESLLSVYVCIYYLEFCKNSFSVTSFLQHKLKFSQPRFQINCYASSKATAPLNSSHPELFMTLKRWRDQIVQESNLPIYMVANQATIQEICTYLPLNKKDLMLLSGFGKAKVETYGDEILEIVTTYCDRNFLETNIEAKKLHPKSERVSTKSETKIDTKTATFELYKSGKSIAEISKERNLTIGTIEGHLSHFIQMGELEIDKLVTKEKQEQIKHAILQQKTVNAGNLKSVLPANIGFGEIRMVVSSLNKKSEAID